MRKEYSYIYNRCFPEYAMSHERFEGMMSGDNVTAYDYYEGGECVAFALVEDFAIRLICVLPDMQKKGIGSALLGRIEEDLKNRGKEKALTGGSSSRLFIGAVQDSWGFFEKFGYKSVGGCDEMLIKLKDFELSDYNLRGSGQAEYCFYKGDIEAMKKAVAAVDESWVQYYSDSANIYAAMVDGEIASFCLVDLNCQNYLTEVYGKVGMPGCVGCVPKFRNRGIALEMVARATQYLKEEGMDISFIFYTGVARWYEKIGYKTFLSEIFGVKEL